MEILQFKLHVIKSKKNYNSNQEESFYRSSFNLIIFRLLGYDQSYLYGPLVLLYIGMFLSSSVWAEIMKNNVSTRIIKFSLVVF